MEHISDLIVALLLLSNKSLFSGSGPFTLVKKDLYRFLDPTLQPLLNVSAKARAITDVTEL